DQARPRDDDMGRWTGLTALPVVSGVRVPVSGQPRAVGAVEKTNTEDVLRASGLAHLHKAGYKGKGVLLAVIDGDFRGWQGLVGTKLPARTRLFDLTAERNHDMKRDTAPEAGGVGQGTQIALAAAAAAPEAEILLIRIDPAAPYELLTLARAMNG